MCTVCGCGETDEHQHGHGGHGHHETHHHDYSQGAAGVHVAGMDQARLIRIEQDILTKNNSYADANRRRFSESSILCLNLVSSPGSGKTTLLTNTIEALGTNSPICVIEGDQQTSVDAERIRATGVQAIQINTGKGCHLDAHMVGHAVEQLQPQAGSVLFIENVGNLVCPAAFDLGEACKVVILSVTEGEDKPLKYPNMFHAADLMILNKIDLLPYVDFNVDQCLEYARRVNPRIKILQLSASKGEGMQNWLNWIKLNLQLTQIEQTSTKQAGPA